MSLLSRSLARTRLLCSRLGSLLLLFQRTPVIQMLFPEARLLSSAGVGEITTWAVATVIGLGAYDSVAGATTITQILPNPVVNPIPATAGTGLSVTIQVLGAPGSPGSWQVSVGSLPPGMTKTSTGSTCTIAGTPTTPGNYPFTIKAWENSNNSGGSISKALTIDVAAVPPTITKDPVSTTINKGSTATLTITASGTSPNFQWYIGSPPSTANPVSGATSASYTTPTTLSATTSYWARASNAGGNDNSKAATVTIITPPTIASHPGSTQINKGSSALVKKVLDSAVHNAKQKGLTEEQLYISRITADHGGSWKRFRAASFGRATPILRRTTHLTIELDVATQPKVKKG